MDLKKLRNEIKTIALDSGAKLVGFGNKERLEQAPPSGNMEYCLPGAQSCIIWVYPNPIKALEDYFSKKDRMAIKRQMDFAYKAAWFTAVEIQDFIENNSPYKVYPVVPNGKYRPQKGGIANLVEMDIQYPNFSLRYGGVAAGLGHIGWSGNLVTKEYGGSIFLGGVITTAPFEPDPMAPENHCNNCRICQKACTTGYVSLKEVEDRFPVIIGGVKQVYGKRGTYLRCGIGCAGWTGVSENRTWSIWSPVSICLKEISEEEWTAERKSQLFNELYNDKKTPETLRNFNRTILNQFAKVGAAENVALRPLKDTNPRCGNCSFICVANPKKRVELWKKLKSSGRVYLDEKGREYVEKINREGINSKYYPPTEDESFTEQELNETPIEESELNGFASILSKMMEPLNTHEEFIQYAKNLKLKILLGTSDGLGTALVQIEKGSIHVEAVADNIQDNSKNHSDWDGKLIAPLSVFIALSSGNLTQKDLIKKAIQGELKMKGLFSLLVLRKIITFSSGKKEKDTTSKKDHSLIQDSSKNIKSASSLFLFTGILHVAIAIAAFGLIEPMVTAIIFAFFVLLLSRMMIKLHNYNIALETPVIISSTTVSFLNTITYLTILFTGMTQNRLMLNILMITVVLINIFNFIVFFNAKIRFERMENLETMSYLTIVMLKGLGLGFLFYMLAYIGYIDGNPNFVMLGYNLIFGLAIIFYGEKLYEAKESKKVQINGVITLILATAVGLFLFFLYPNPKILINTALFSFIIATRVYYINKVF